MNKKIIIVLAQKRFYKIDRYKFEIDKFLEKKIDIELHELVNIISPEINKSFQNSLSSDCIKNFSNLFQWENHLNNLIKKYGKDNLLIFNFILPHSLKSLKINYFIKIKSKLPVIEFFGSDMPIGDEPIFKKFKNLKLLLGVILKFIKFPMKIRIFLRSKLCMLLSYLFNLNPRYHLIFGDKDIKKLENKIKKNIVFGNSLDQNLYLVGKKAQPVSLDFYKDKDYAIFLESATPLFEGDNQLIGEHKEAQITKENWTISLNKFFSFLEKELRLQVLISPHPKVKHPNKFPDYYYGRRVLDDFAYLNSKKAKLLITRISTGISNAILNNIPIMIIYNNEIKRNKGMLSKQFFISNQIGVDPINIDNYDKNYILNRSLDYNKDKYQKYKKNYLTLREDNLKNSDIFIELLDKQSK